MNEDTIFDISKKLKQQAKDLLAKLKTQEKQKKGFKWVKIADKTFVLRKK